MPPEAQTPLRRTGVRVTVLDEDAAVTIVATGLDGATWTSTTHTITESTGQVVNVNADDERNYSNPV